MLEGAGPLPVLCPGPCQYYFCFKKNSADLLVTIKSSIKRSKSTKDYK
jgi:hypothetical protein